MKNSMFKKPLFVLEMANNHMGEASHGVKIIEAFGAVCGDFPEFDFGFKFQYRDLDTFVHPKAKGSQDIKLVKRFEETRLSREDFRLMLAAMEKEGFIPVCTPFDEPSVKAVEEDGFKILKIASCSVTDWPLLERAAGSGLPMIVSTAGASQDEVTQVNMFLANREKEYALMHCVAEYPTQDKNLRLERIRSMIREFPKAVIGYSTHESPDAVLPVALAIAAGARIFEKHVGLATEKHQVNAYSAQPAQVRAWLESAKKAFEMTGQGGAAWPEASALEKQSLRELRRGLWAKAPIKKGDRIDREMFYFAFPPESDQFLANDCSKYAQFTAQSDIPADGSINPRNTRMEDVKERLRSIARRIKGIISDAKVSAPEGEPLEISHHYGLESFEKTGLAMFTVINREYCKKILVMCAGQDHPEQWHEEKEETFVMVKGRLKMRLDGVESEMKAGDVLTIKRGERHQFSALEDTVFEEISTNHGKSDSFYTDPAISANKNRKSFLRYWMGA